MRNPVKNAKEALLHNRKHLLYAIFHRLSWMIPNDRLYLKWYYKLSMGKKLDLDQPTGFNEKLQWLKLYNRKPEYTMMVDKYAVKQYVADKIGEEYVIPTLKVWDKPRKIDLSELPNQFVLKTNHDGGCNGIVVCKDKQKLDVKKAKRELRHSFYFRNPYLKAREWPYKNVKKCVFAEQYMEDAKTGELRDYKFFCFNGVPKILFVATERNKDCGGVKFDFFDMDFNHLNIINGHPWNNVPIEQPRSFDKMKELAAVLAEGIPHVRIDFYEVNGQPYFGEYTFSHMGGTGNFEPNEWNDILGSWIKLPEKTIN